MALDRTDLLQLMKTVARADKSAPIAYSYDGKNYSYDVLNDTLRKELNEYAGNYQLYRENKNLIFSLIEETIGDVLPRKLEQSYGSFAETRTFNQGDKPIFRRKTSNRTRAKQFITRVGLAGLYETFRLGETWFEVKTSAIGGAAHIGFEEFLDGRVDFAELVQIVIEGMDELIYKEIAAALIASIDQLPGANQVATAGFDEKEMDRLISIAASYGNPTIYCTREFASTMLPADGAWVSDNMRDEVWRVGYLGNYKGVNIIVLPQTYEDENNERKAIDPSYAWVIPSDGNTKPVKVAFEGTMHMKDIDNYDWSREIHYYQKVGVGVIMTNNICVYHNEELTRED